MTFIERSKIIWYFQKFSKNPQNTPLVFKLFELSLNLKDKNLVNMHINKMYEKNNILNDYQKEYSAQSFLDGFMDRFFENNTLGNHLQNHFKKNNLDINFYPEVFKKDRNQKNYIVNRAYEVHDLWHTLLALDTEPIDEMAILSFTAGQLNSAITTSVAFAAYTNCIQTNLEWDTSLFEFMSKAFELGKKARSLLVYKPEQFLDKSISEIRQELNLPIEGLIKPGNPLKNLDFIGETEKNLSV